MGSCGDADPLEMRQPKEIPDPEQQVRDSHGEDEQDATRGGPNPARKHPQHAT